MQSKLLLRALTVTVAVATAALAPAYETIRSGSALVKWPNGTIPMQIKLGTTPTLQDGTNYSSSVQAAMTSWNAVLRNVQFDGTVAAAGAGADRNGLNEIFFASDIFGTAFESGTLAVTTSYRSTTLSSDGTYRRTQSDITFNTAWKWESYRGARQSTTSVGVDIRRVAIHELGHVLGLDHPDEWGQTVSAVMNSHISDIDAATRDDIDGAQYIYGVAGTATAPANDNFAAATAITLPASNTVTVTGSSLSATKESGEPNHASDAGGASVWWKWTATLNGSLEVKTAGTPVDTLLGAYTGSAVNALTLLASNDDVEPAPTSGTDSQTRNRTSIVTIPVTAGTTYYFAVDGWQGEWSSNISLTLTLAPTTTAPTITTQPASQTVTAGTSVTFSVTATGVPTPTYQWLKNGTAINGATAATYTLSSPTTADAGSYTVTVSNSAGSVTSNAATLTVNAAVTPSSSGGGGGGGGGAPSHWFVGALALAALARWRQRRQ